MSLNLLFLIKGVSTIPDECKGVGLEIGTKPKRKAPKGEDIVSATGDSRIKRVELRTVLTSTRNQALILKQKMVAEIFVL